MLLKNGTAFQNRQEDKYSTEEVVSALEQYIEPYDELDGVLLENDQLKAMYRSTLWYGFKGTNVKLFLEEWRVKHRELQKNQPQKSVTKQFYTGHNITISKTYGGYEFTDAELDKLFDGDSITFTFITSYGNERTVSGRIERKDWPQKEIEFYAIVVKELENQEDNLISGIYQGNNIRFKNTFADHKLTEDEIKKLLDGKAIYQIITNKNGNKTAVRIKLVQVENDFYKLQGQFEDIPFYRYSGREFTPDEIEQLHLGRVLLIDGLKTKDGKIYQAKIRWHDGKYQRKTKNGFNNNYDAPVYDGYGNGDADSF